MKKHFTIMIGIMLVLVFAALAIATGASDHDIPFPEYSKHKTRGKFKSQSALMNRYSMETTWGDELGNEWLCIKNPLTQKYQIYDVITHTNNKIKSQKIGLP